MLTGPDPRKHDPVRQRIHTKRSAITLCGELAFYSVRTSHRLPSMSFQDLVLDLVDAVMGSVSAECCRDRLHQ